MRSVLVAAMLVGQARADCVTPEEAHEHALHAENDTSTAFSAVFERGTFRGLHHATLELGSETLGRDTQPHPIGSSFERNGNTYIAGPTFDLDNNSLSPLLDLVVDEKKRVFVVQHVSRKPHREHLVVCGCPPVRDSQFTYGPLDADQTFGGELRIEHETWEVEISYACKKSSGPSRSGPHSDFAFAKS